MVNKASIHVYVQSNGMRINMFKLGNASGAICGLGLH